MLPIPIDFFRNFRSDLICEKAEEGRILPDVLRASKKHRPNQPATRTGSRARLDSGNPHGRRGCCNRHLGGPLVACPCGFPTRGRCRLRPSRTRDAPRHLPRWPPRPTRHGPVDLPAAAAAPSGLEIVGFRWHLGQLVSYAFFPEELHTTFSSDASGAEARKRPAGSRDAQHSMCIVPAYPNHGTYSRSPFSGG